MATALSRPGRDGSAPEQLSQGSGRALLEHAHTALIEALWADDSGERFRLAHIAALRAGAAVVAERHRPASTRRRLMSVWLLIGSIAPEYREWADYFAAGASARAAVEAGAVNVVSARDADDQIRAATEFLTVVEQARRVPAALAG